MKITQALRGIFCGLLIVLMLTGTVALAGSYPTGTYYCNGNHVNVRSGPSNSYPSQYKLNRGDVVTATGNSNGWMYISYFNKDTNTSETGFIYRKYLYQVPTKSSKEDYSGATYKTTANLRVRSQASTTKGYVKTKLKKGTKVKVSRQKHSWVYITYKGGSGWVSAKYLKKVN